MSVNIDSLPEHVPVYIDVDDFKYLENKLKAMSFRFTPFQIINPRQIYAKIMDTSFNGENVELHFRCYTSGKLEAEYEPKRIGSIVRHLSRRSYSAHEFIISLLKELNISFSIDEQLRQRYNTNFPKDFPKQRGKFFHWLFISCLMIYPIGVLWRMQWEFKQKFNSLFRTGKPKDQTTVTSGD